MYVGVDLSSSSESEQREVFEDRPAVSRMDSLDVQTVELDISLDREGSESRLVSTICFQLPRVIFGIISYPLTDFSFFS